jgi:signal transduction histidine kinase
MSLRLRLAIWYGGLTGLAVVLVALFAYAEHARTHYDEMDRTLLGATEHLAGVHTAQASPRELTDALAVPFMPHLVMAVYGPDAEVLAVSPHAEQAPSMDPRAVLAGPSVSALDLVARLAPSLRQAEADGGRFGLITAATGERWRLYARPLGETRALLAAAPLAEIDTSVGLFRRYMAVLAALAAGLSLAGAYLVARSALHPIATLTETAGAIARSRSFSRRVPPGTGQDELGRLALTFNDMLASLEEAYRSQQRFVGDASHELRAPLTAIQANLELLERRPDMPADERREAVTEASREAHRLARLVAELLALARADAGLTLRREPVELDRVLLDVLSQARHLAHGQRLEVGPLQPTVVQANPDSLKQLLLILLDNAIRYTPPEGRIGVELERNGRAAEVRVRDTGVGIPAADLPRVFDRFYRADPARARDPGGAGLGLSIARWIADQHGGEVSLESAPGRGTTALVRLPLA